MVIINCAYKAGHKFLSKKLVKKLGRVVLAVIQRQEGSLLLLLMQ